MRWTVVVAGLVACSRPLATARLSTLDAPMPEERAAKHRIDDRSCSVYWTFAFPGIGQLCLGQREGAAIAAAAAADAAVAAAAAVTVDDPGLGHPAIALP